MPADLLHTKLNVPSLQSSLIPRPHLIEHLNQSLQPDHKLTLLSAPAGYGKSTLVVDWLNGQKNTVAWLSLDTNDDDPRRFLTYVVASLNRALPDFGEDLLHLLQTAGQEPALEPVSTIILNQLAALDTPIILVLDDYQVLESPNIHEIVSYWLDHLPDNLHLIITSRSEPHLPLARLRARRQLIEINLQALRFTRRETEQYLLQIMGIILSAEDVRMLAERTEGWPAGLHLAALSLQDAVDPANFVANFSGSNRMVFDYLADEVLTQQAPETRDFLLQTSILDRLCASLCDALLERQPPIPSQQILEELDASGLFVFPLDHERRWFRYHPLFADQLRNRLQRAYPERLAMLHGRAIRWHEANGQLPEAIQHAFAAGDIETAGHLLQQNAREMIRRGEAVTLLNWLQALPAETIQDNPRLGLSLALTRLLAGKFASLDVVLSPLQTAEESLAATDDPETTGLHAEIDSVRAVVLVEQGETTQGLALAKPALAELSADTTRYGAFLRGSLASTLALAHRDQGRTEEAAQIYAEVRALSEASDNTVLALLAAYELGKLRAEQGQLRQAKQIYRDSMNWLENRFRSTVNALPLSGAAHIGLGRLFLERNQLDRAREHLETGVQRARHRGGLGIDRDGLLALSLAYQAQNEVDRALETIVRAMEHARSSPRPDALLRAEAVQVRLWLAQENITAVARWADQLQHSRWDQYPAEVTAVALARVHLAQEKPQLVLDLLAQCLPIVEAGGRHGRLLEILALQAVAYHQLGQVDQALSDLKNSLILAAPQGYTRLYLDLGQPLAQLLYQARQRNISPEYTGQLLAAIVLDVKTVDAQATHSMIEPLSDREMEVLQLMATGLSNREIGLRLYLSPNTIKRHANNIYEKLGVHSRTEAASKARILGILD